MKGFFYLLWIVFGIVLERLWTVGPFPTKSDQSPIEFKGRGQTWSSPILAHHLSVFFFSYFLSTPRSYFTHNSSIKWVFNENQDKASTGRISQSVCSRLSSSLVFCSRYAFIFSVCLLPVLVCSLLLADGYSNIWFVDIGSIMNMVSFGIWNRQKRVGKGKTRA
jgi:hypothetical protein